MKPWPTPQIPDNRDWPAGFTTNYVTVFPDQPWLLSWQGPVRVDLRPAAWWHDLSYWAGYLVHHETPLEQVRTLAPIPNAERHRAYKRHIDRHMEINFMEAGMSRGTARVARWIVKRFGALSFWWATPQRWASISHQWGEPRQLA